MQRKGEMILYGPIKQEKKTFYFWFCIPFISVF